MRSRTYPVGEFKRYLSEPWVDQTRKSFISGDTAYVPVMDGYPCTAILPERRRKGRGFQRIGDIIAFHGEKPFQSTIDEVISSHHPKGIIWYRSHEGNLRVPDIEVVWGEAGEVRLKEAGITYHFNVKRVMFSQGNRQEKMRVVTFVNPGERCCDMFAGIGYFTLPLAKAGAMVHAIELNPSAVEYLIINRRLNGLETWISISSGDCREHMTGSYDRIQMGYYEALSFLPYALRHSHSGTVLHVHSIGDINKDIQITLKNAGMTGTISSNLIKTIGPCKCHMVYDVVIN